MTFKVSHDSPSNRLCASAITILCTPNLDIYFFLHRIAFYVRPNSTSSSIVSSNATSSRYVDIPPHLLCTIWPFPLPRVSNCSFYPTDQLFQQGRVLKRRFLSWFTCNSTWLKANLKYLTKVLIPKTQKSHFTWGSFRKIRVRGYLQGSFSGLTTTQGDKIPYTFKKPCQFWDRKSCQDTDFKDCLYFQN